jgi:hypothetical protein
MTEAELTLYDRILRFSFDEGDATLTFTHRLARENSWTRSYTSRVIDEYKRFIFLAVVASHPVTPSDQVDQVWHLHLTYTRCYWERLCGQVIGAPLHHGPTQGGAEEARKFRCSYAMTLQSYRRYFGHEPPTDIWPDTSIRFGNGLFFKRINVKQNWVIEKHRMTRTAVKIAVLVFAMFSPIYFPSAINGVLNHLGLLSSTSLPSGQNASKAPRDTQPYSQSDDSNGDSFPYLWFAIMIVGFVFTIVFQNKCPECKRLRAMKYNGNDLSATEHEYQCKYCGHREWREDDSACGCG